MSRKPYSDKNGKKKGPWSKDEDVKLKAYIKRYGHWNWSEIPRFAGVSRCGKSCRLRWMNYLRPNMKRGNITKEEEDIIVELHDKIGNKWSTIAAKLPGRSNNEIKNYWNTNFRKRIKHDHNVTQSSCSPSTSSSSSSSSLLNGFDTSVSCGEPDVGSFWTDPLFTDYDITRLNEYSLDFDLAQASFFHDTFMDDEFLWSTMDLYNGYHSELAK